MTAEMAASRRCILFALTVCTVEHHDAHIQSNAPLMHVSTHSAPGSVARHPRAELVCTFSWVPAGGQGRQPPSQAEVCSGPWHLARGHAAVHPGQHLQRKRILAQHACLPCCWWVLHACASHLHVSVTHASLQPCAHLLCKARLHCAADHAMRGMQYKFTGYADDADQQRYVTWCCSSCTVQCPGS